MKRKILSFALIFTLVLQLSSCKNFAKKDTAYCFSAVFDAKENGVNITLYCRIPDNSSSENSTDKETVLTLSGNSFTEALESDIHSQYEIYYNSIKAFYFSHNLSREQLIEVAAELYNKTKYQTAAMVYSPRNNNAPAADVIHSDAKKICTDKGIQKDDKGNYVNFTEYIRRNTTER